MRHHIYLPSLAEKTTTRKRKRKPKKPNRHREWAVVMLASYPELLPQAKNLLARSIYPYDTLVPHVVIFQMKLRDILS